MHPFIDTDKTPSECTVSGCHTLIRSLRVTLVRVSGHLRVDWHNDGAVLQLPDAPFVVENEVGQGRVQELPLLGIHGKVGNVDAPRVALRVVYTRLYTPMYAPYIRVCIRLYTPIYAPIYAERAMSTPRRSGAKTK